MEVFHPSSSFPTLRDEGLCSRTPGNCVVRGRIIHTVMRFQQEQSRPSSSSGAWGGLQRSRGSNYSTSVSEHRSRFQRDTNFKIFNILKIENNIKKYVKQKY